MRDGLRHLAVFIAASMIGVQAANAQGQKPQVVTIAVAGPMTGKFKALGKQMQVGAQMIVADLNAKGGLNGRRIELITADDKCDAREAAAVARRLVAKKILFVAGHLCSRASIPAAAIYARAGIVMISPGSTHPQLTDTARRNGWRNVFRVCGRDDDQGRVIGRLLAEQFKDKPVAVLHDRTEYGRSLARVVTATVKKLGARIALRKTYNPEAEDHSDLVEQLKKAKIEAVFLGAYHAEGARIIRDAHKRDFKPQFVAGDAFVTEKFWQIASKAGEGTLVTFQFDPRLKPAAKLVMERSKKAKKPLEFYGLYTYAAIEIWAAAAQRLRSFEAAQVSKALRQGSYKTVIGDLSFNANGDVKTPQYVWYVWKDGKYKAK